MLAIVCTDSAFVVPFHPVCELMPLSEESSLPDLMYEALNSVATPDNGRCIQLLSSCRVKVNSFQELSLVEERVHLSWWNDCLMDI